MKLSALICVYGGDDVGYFIDAYNSILDQSVPPDQIVLVVDGPVSSKMEGSISDLKTKSSASSIEFKDVWIKENSGHGNARKQGVLNCQYDFVAITDADDINDINRFSKQKHYLESNPSVSVVGSMVLEVDDKHLFAISEKLVPQNHEDIIEYLKYRCPLNQMSVMFRRVDVIRAGNYVSFYHNEDYYLWLRMFIKGFKFHNLPEFLVKARVNDGFYNRRGGLSYFLSEFRIQKFMLSNGIINFIVFSHNCIIRFILQVLFPSSLRGFIFSRLFRKRVK